MSAIYFHTLERTATVRGWERANAGLTTDKIGFALLIETVGVDGLREFMPASQDMKTFPDNPAAIGINSWAERLRLLMQWGDGTDLFEYDGGTIASWDLLLNTAYAAGSDSIKLMTRVHAQCEIHCRVHGEDRDWFAGLVEQGRADGVLRAGSGWEDVVELARATAAGPIVMSYSVTEGFPSRSRTTYKFQSDDSDEEWERVPESEKWRTGIEFLEQKHPRLQPSDWADYRFGHSISAFDLAATLWDRKMAAAS